MEVLNWLNQMVLDLMDPVLGWMLALHRDVIIIAIGVVTGAILVAVRLFSTNQDLLKRVFEDKKRLGALIKEAKAGKDKAALQRHRNVNGSIAMKAMMQEGWPLLASLLPIALLGTWAFQRLEFHPPGAGELVEVVAYYPVSAVETVIHIVPQEGLVPEGGWVRQLKEVTDQGQVYAEATWKIKADPRPKPYVLEFRHKAGTVSNTVLVGQRTYEPAITDCGKERILEVRMKPVKMFGFIPALPPPPPLLPVGFFQYWPAVLVLPPWLVGYFIVAIPSVSLFKKVFGIY
ncbi:MAG: hypothetical protein V1809_09750 [Planctomycetota bacterium]